VFEVWTSVFDFQKMNLICEKITMIQAQIFYLNIVLG